jgi:hypothetical protein
MSPERQPWYAVGPETGTVMRCAACGNEFDLQDSPLDHHSRVCPVCGVECAFLNWKGRTVQVVPARAPAPFAAALRWAQEHLDELDYVELLCAVEELTDAASAATPVE